jgi:hypothetical protein
MIAASPEHVLAEQELDRRARLELKRRGVPLWEPLAGPQTLAVESEADETLYGGAAGGGKSDWLLGTALTRHRRSIIFRREYPQVRALAERSKEIIRDEGVFNQTELLWRLADERTLEFGAVQHDQDKDKYQGRPHDFIGFDEGAHFTEAVYLFLTGWLRTTDPGQRCRIGIASNPPTDTEGEWLIRRWAAWLDAGHPHPARPGELRWYAMVDGKEVERPDGTPFAHGGETITPRSRTFIPARVTDNPHLLETGYVATLQAMPEPLRSQLLYGDFTIGLADDEWQVIPAAWVRAAQARWTERRPTVEEEGRVVPVPLSQIGADVAQGGSDNTVLARRYGDWFAEPEVHPGSSVPDAAANATRIERALLEGGIAAIDSDGIGSSTYHLLVALVGRKRVAAYRGSARTTTRDRSGVLGFVNVRAAAWWALRDALDPSHGARIALPPNRELRAELCAARYEKQSNGIKIEDKDETKKRIGRSPDLGDAYVMAHWPGGAVDFEAVAQPLSLGWQSGAETVQDEMKRLSDLLGELPAGRVTSSGGGRR